MDATHHMAAIMEVDLSACHPNTLVDRINAVPVLKTSAAFFTFLRANLVLPQSEMSSNFSTPILGPVGSHTVTKKAPSAAKGTTASSPNGADTALDDIPPLTLGVLTERINQVDALQLVADSVAQQRQTASRSLIFHPLNLAGLAAGVGIAYNLIPRHDLGVMLTVMSGVFMSYLAAIRYFSSQYINLAEQLKWDWLKPKSNSKDGDPEQEEDTIIGARYGEEIIGALVLRLEVPSLSADKVSSSFTDGKKASARSSTPRSTPRSTNGIVGGHGLVRGWTTKLRYRRRGIGGDLLQEALRVTRERYGKDAEISFAADHANHVMILPEMFNGPFRKTEKLAAKVLEKTLSS